MNFWNPFIRIASRVASKGNRPTGSWGSMKHQEMKLGRMDSHPLVYQRKIHNAILKNIGTGAQLNKLKRQEKAIAALKDGQRRNLLTRAAPLRIKTKYAVRDAERRIRGPVGERIVVDGMPLTVRKHDTKITAGILGTLGAANAPPVDTIAGKPVKRAIGRIDHKPRRTPTRPQKPRRGRRR